MTDWQPLATAMIEKLTAAGELTDPAWQQAFIDTPRHVFVPDYDLSDTYSPAVLVTQWRTAGAPITNALVDVLADGPHQ